MATLFVRNGQFSLLNFQAETGYTFTLILHVIRELEGLGLSEADTQFYAVTAFNALLFALIGSILGPNLAEAAWPDHHWGPRRRIALTTVLLIFWGGNLSYPLTDFPGLAFACLALVAIARPTSPGWMIVAGAATAVAINMRPAYLPIVPALAFIVLLARFGGTQSPHASRVRHTVSAGLLVAAFLMVLLPQSLVAHRYFHTWNAVYGTYPAANVQFLMTYGMAFQRVDSYDGPAGPSALVYRDQAGLELLRRQPKTEIKGMSQYLGLVITHPVAMIPLLARHLIDGLDARYNTIYVEHRDGDGRLPLRLAGFLIVFLAIVRLLWPAARRSLGNSRWRYLIALALCSLTSLTTAIETRYALPVYLLCYLLVLAPGWPNPIDHSKVGLRRLRTPALLVVAYIAFMAVVWHVVGNLHGEVIFAFSLPGPH